MIKPPELVETTPQFVATLPLTVPQKEITKVMHPGICALMTTLRQQNIRPAGPLFNHHLRMHPEIFDFEISVATASPVEETELVKARLMPARRVIRTVYHGQYEGLGKAWGELRAWAEAQGHKLAEDLWECYIVGPESSDDVTHWRTELNQPVL